MSQGPVGRTGVWKTAASEVEGKQKAKQNNILNIAQNYTGCLF